MYEILYSIETDFLGNWRMLQQILWLKTSSIEFYILKLPKYQPFTQHQSNQVVIDTSVINWELFCILSYTVYEPKDSDRRHLDICCYVCDQCLDVLRLL